MTHLDVTRAAQARWDRFRRDWSDDPRINWDGAEEAFYALSAEDQDDCSRHAWRFISRCKSEGWFLQLPRNWIASRGWQGFRDHERKAAKRWVIFGSRAWDAWEADRKAKGMLMPAPLKVKSERGRGWWMPSLFPPSEAPTNGYKEARDGL